MTSPQRPSPDANRESALTLIEALVYTALVGLIGTPLTVIVLTSSRAVAESRALGKAEDNNRSLAFRLSREVRTAISGSVQVTDGGKTLSFDLATGFGEEGPITDTTIRYELIPGSGETENGLDDNGNGLVDEARLLRRDLGSGEDAPVGENLSLADSHFSLVDGTSVALSLTSLGYFPQSEENPVIKVTREVTVNPRN